jgi:hypothetical protein
MSSLSKELLGDNLHEALKKLTFSQAKHRLHTPSRRGSLYNIDFMFMIAHLRVEVL